MAVRSVLRASIRHSAAARKSVRVHAAYVFPQWIVHGGEVARGYGAKQDVAGRMKKVHVA